MPPRRPRDDPYGTVELFPASAGKHASECEKPLRRNAARSVRQGKCPSCTAPSIGLIHVGNHLAWRYHTYRTWAGTTMPCRASVIPVCLVPERNPLIRSDPATCPHDRK